ncbi:MAG: RNase E specificity factor CsrD [Plesiomonas sp.]
MRFTTRFVAFVTSFVGLAVVVMLIGGTIGFRQLAEDQITHRWQTVVTVVDQKTHEHGPSDLKNWLPPILMAAQVRSLVITDGKNVLYQYDGKSLHHLPNDLLVHYSYPLLLEPGLTVNITAADPLVDYTYSMVSMSSISLAAGLVLIGLILGLNWLREQLIGAEILEDRARLILNKGIEDIPQRDPREWPQSASIVLDRLMVELQDARQERSRFDTFIRSHTFLDQLTGVSNRMFFDNQLSALLDEPDSQGSVMVVRLADIDVLRHDLSDKVADTLIQDLVAQLSTFVLRIPNGLLARYFDGDFAAILPQQNIKEAGQLAEQILKMVQQLPLPHGVYSDAFLFIGIVGFHQGDMLENVMDEAEMAVRSASLQGTNSWFASSKSVADDQPSRGSVRWRTLLENALSQHALHPFTQTIFTRDGASEQVELFVRIRDEQGNWLRLVEFMPMVKQLGLAERFDREIMLMAIQLLAKIPANEGVAISLTVDALLRKSFQYWLRDLLMQQPREIRQRLFLELAEADLCQHIDRLRVPARFLKGMDCKLVINQAGLTVVNTFYIKLLQIDIIKLHPSLVHNIHQRPENQLFVRSLIGACAGTSARLYAVGVQSTQEWANLRKLGVYAGQGLLFSPVKPVVERSLLPFRRHQP